MALHTRNTGKVSHPDWSDLTLQIPMSTSPSQINFGGKYRKLRGPATSNFSVV